MGEDEIKLPCYPADQPAFKPEGDLAFLRIAKNNFVHLHYELVDTIVELDSALHITLFRLLDEDRYPMTYLMPVLVLDSRTPLATYQRLMLELIKAGFWQHRLQGCNDQQFDLTLPPYSTVEVGYHAEQVASKLPPQPPKMDLAELWRDSSTVMAILEPQQPLYYTITGEEIKELRRHIQVYEKVLHLYKPVEGSTFDDLFHFYSDVHCAIEELRGPKEPDSTYRQLRQKYPMRILQYPQD